MVNYKDPKFLNQFGMLNDQHKKRINEIVKTGTPEEKAKVKDLLLKIKKREVSQTPSMESVMRREDNAKRDAEKQQSINNKPPVNKPPVNKPPVNKPPVNKPPVNKPPVNKPVSSDVDDTISTPDLDKAIKGANDMTIKFGYIAEPIQFRGSAADTFKQVHDRIAQIQKHIADGPTDSDGTKEVAPVLSSMEKAGFTDVNGDGIINAMDQAQIIDAGGPKKRPDPSISIEDKKNEGMTSIETDNAETRLENGRSLPFGMKEIKYITNDGKEFTGYVDRFGIVRDGDFKQIPLSVLRNSKPIKTTEKKPQAGFSAKDLIKF